MATVTLQEAQAKLADLVHRLDARRRTASSPRTTGRSPWLIPTRPSRRRGRPSSGRSAARSCRWSTSTTRWRSSRNTCDARCSSIRTRLDLGRDDPAKVPPAGDGRDCRTRRTTCSSARRRSGRSRSRSAIGKLPLSLPYRPWMDKAVADLGLAVLPITLDHAERQVGLPFHHRDPFDRLIAAQALVEGIPLVSGDADLRRLRRDPHLGLNREPR